MPHNWKKTAVLTIGGVTATYVASISPALSVLTVLGMLPALYWAEEGGEDNDEVAHDNGFFPNLAQPSFIPSVQPPLKQSSLGMQIKFGTDAASGHGVIWQPNNTAVTLNTNTGIIGTMGTGKTQFTKSVVYQMVSNKDNKGNIGFLIIDYKSDYVDSQFVTATQAKVFKLHRLPYNPLSLFGDMPMLPVHTAAGFTDTMGRAFNLGQKQRLRLQNAVIRCYEAAGIHADKPQTWGNLAPTIADLWEVFTSTDPAPEEDSLYAALSKLASFQIFEPDAAAVQGLYALVSGAVVVEVAGYPPDVQNLVVGLTLDLFYAQMQRHGKPSVSGDFRQITKMILVDEADNFMSQNYPSLRKILKEGREYGVGLILSTQFLSHFKSETDSYSDYILTWIVHKVSNINAQGIAATFNVAEKAEQQSLMNEIRKLEKHCSLYINGQKEITRLHDLPFFQIAKNRENI